MTIRYDKSEHIVVITIDRYERRNSIDIEHAAAMVNAWERFRDDDDARVAIVTGVNDVFCAGGDLEFMGRIASEMAATGRSDTLDAMSNYGRGTFTLKGFELFKPVIAAVNGYCMAGGMELLGGTDIRIASSDAVFQITEPKRGMIAGGGTTARLPRQLAWPAAMELLLVADRISADRAMRLGLVNDVVAPEALLNSAMDWARRIAANAPLSMQLTKKAALLGLAADNLDEAYRIEDACAEASFNTDDAVEGARAFFEKRPPVWKGR